jgi:hypothetical protein
MVSFSRSKGKFQLDARTGMPVKVNVRQLLAFFDADETVAPHANSVKSIFGEELGFALLTKHFESSGIAARMGRRLCTQGKRKGCRLDGWLIIQNDGADLYYQVEVKAWSQHSLGGKRLSLSATPAELRAFKKERWERYWSGTAFKDPALAKVLVPMLSPMLGARVEPLACIWDAVHPAGDSTPLFAVDLLPGSTFKKVSVFSMSAFLRTLSSEILELDLNAVRERLLWLGRIFPT